MKVIFIFLLLASVITVAGCMNTASTPPIPVGRGYLNMCNSDPPRADYWQKNEDVLWSSPGNGAAQNDHTIVVRVPSCANISATIWEYRLIDNTKWSHVSIQTNDGLAYDGWLPAGNITGTTNETGTEWSNNYSSIVGLWDRTGQGNGAKIWYDFNTDGTYTFNYDMRGNKENVQDRGSWVYIGNRTYDLVSNTYNDHRHIPIALDQTGKTFNSGAEYSSDSDIGREIVYVKE